MSLLTRLSLKSRWLTFLVAILVTAASIWAIITLKMELIPDIELPMASVMTVYPGAPPDRVADEVTVPVEKAIADAGQTKEITSTSARNMSFVLAQYDYGTDMDDQVARISQNLQNLTLPSAVQPPQVFPLSLDLLPVVSLSLGGDVSTTELRSMAISQIVPKLEAIDGVYSVEVVGGEEQAVVTLDIEKLNQAGVSASQLAAIVGASEYSSLAEIENIPLAMPRLGHPEASHAVLKDIASVALSPAPGTAITRTNGKPSVGISVFKHPEANTVAVANAVVEEAERIQGTLSKNVKIVPVLDQSEFIESAISDLYREAIIGAVLAMLVILVFMMAFRASLVTTLSIPLSILIGFLVMRLWGITINMVTLTAMAIAVGRVIDDAIVILEVIYRRLQQGEEFREAAVNGAREVGAPITSATIATVAVFVPLAFVGGIVGEMFRPFALTATFALVASLVVALTVVPALCGFILPKVSEHKPEPKLRKTRYQRAYEPVLKWALGHRALTLVIAAVLFFSSLALLPLIGTTFIPSTGEESITATVEMPLGADLETTSQKVAQVEKVIAENFDWLTYESTVGTSTMFGGMAALMGGGSSSANIVVILRPNADLEAEAARLRQLVEPLAGDAEITVSSGSEQDMHAAGMSSSSVTITVIGDNTADVTQAAGEVTANLKQIGGLVNIEADIAQVIPQPQIEIDPASVITHGLDPDKIGMELGLLMVGATVSELNLNGETYSVYLAPPMQQVRSLEQLKEVRIGLADTLTLGDIATVTFEPEPTHILRVDQNPAARITAVVEEENVGAINRRVEMEINAMSLTPGIAIKMGGVFEQMTEGFRWMGISILVAIVIAYFVIVVTFRSFLNPLIIMFSLPLASIGALLGLLITGRPMGISALMGILMLVGIVLTNAIVLIALVEQLRKRGLNAFDALVEGGSTRLRPILMTASSTMFAMLPLALGFGEGTVIAAELATVVIGGLLSSTLLTLLVVPVIYSLFDDLRCRVTGR